MSDYQKYQSMSRRSGDTRGEKCIRISVQIFVMAVFILYVMPIVIAPWLGITPEQYEAYELVWSFLGGIIGYPFGWIISKIIARSIRSG